MIAKPIAPFWAKGSGPNRLAKWGDARGNPNALHSLHFGKCAGTKVAGIIAQIKRSVGKRAVVKHRLEMFLSRLPAQARNFFSIREPVGVIRQGHFDNDLDRFLTAAGYDHLRGRIKLSRDATKAHANDYSGTLPLSKKAKNNLRVRYAQDI